MSSSVPDPRLRRVGPNPRPGRAGYALIEALVAFAIVATALAVGLPFFADGLRGVGESEKRLQALAIAESRLADAIGTIPAPLGISEGQSEDGFAWRVTARPVGADDPIALKAAEYVVEVAWPGVALESGIRLATIRVSPPPLPPGPRSRSALPASR